MKKVYKSLFPSSYMHFDFVVLGATGLQGRIASRDLLENGYSVLLCGRDPSRVQDLLKRYKRSQFHSFDANDIEGTTELIKKSCASLVVNCVEKDWNLHILKACMKAKTHCLDLGSDIPMTKRQFSLDSSLKKKNLLCLTGCGSVPGIGNVMLRYAAEKFDSIASVNVGFAWDSNMKIFVVPFSIQSITEEFVYPADMIINHHSVQVKPKNTIVRCYHRDIGREKCFNVGHHPETFTFYEYCKKKGIENVKFFAGFPDHSFNAIKTMIDLGFTSSKALDVDGQKVIPLHFLTEVLKRLEIPRGYTEVENLWVDIYGKKKGKKKHIKMECIVPTLKGWEDAGCNIDTGMPMSIMAQMVLDGRISFRGSSSPEFVVPVEEFFKELRKRKMVVYENGRKVN